MISVTNKKRRFIIYSINTIGLLLYPFYFVLRRKWRNRKQELLSKLKSREALSVTINCTDRLGDILFFTPALRALKKSFPWIKVIILTNKTGGEIFASNPFVNEIIFIDNFWSSKSVVSLPEFSRSFTRKYLTQLREIRNKDLDVLLEVKGDFRNILFLDIWAGAKYLAGYALSGFGWMLDWEMNHKTGLHEIDTKLNIALSLGADITDRRMDIFLSETDEQFARTVFDRNGITENDTIAVFHVGGTWEPRLWPLDNFIEIGKRLKNQYGAKVILIGDRRDEGKIQRFREKVSSSVKLDYATITQTAAIIKKAGIFLGNDSGPLHLARAVRTPLVGIFGPEDVWRVGPEQDGVALQHKFACQPCGQVTCSVNPNCVQSITVEEVWRAVDRLLSQSPRRADS